MNIVVESLPYIHQAGPLCGVTARDEYLGGVIARLRSAEVRMSGKVLYLSNRST